MTNSRVRQLQRTGVGAALLIPSAVILTAPLYTDIKFENALALSGPYFGLIGILVERLWGGNAVADRELDEPGRGG